MALRDLWLLHEADPGNRDVTRLLIDSYYNIGLRALQRQDVKEAGEQFKEALGLSPDDPELLRLADFAATYQTRSTDLLYRIYVKYHPFR
jgi:tetratricopeptide (TPR) repeat protein